ncbi:allophanate hydrolase [Gryllotalpicola koreensis]|uniref:Allophanate hydrolase n=1 Tax=Gryllotalpicola koreensis TaxID=993086 RepID=A0ABP7ZT11_9MICO
MSATAVSRVESAYRDIERSGRPEVWIALRERDAALAEAASVDARVDAGERLPLAGLVAAVKDNIDVAGLPTTAGAASYRYLPDTDATAVARLRAAGAVVLGKTNLDQFATGLVGTRSPFGAVRNAWDESRISGGSSSGSAVAVALGLVDLALGTDTAGSGRVPAALNGIVGVKPTRGLVPTTGVVPACRSIDVVTVFARSRRLASLAVGLMSGKDGIDPLARALPALAPALSPVPRVAVPLPTQLEGLAAGWKEAFAAVVAQLAAGGVEVVETDISPLLEAATLLYGGAFVAERYAAVGAHLEANRELIGDDLDPTVAAIVLAGAAPTAAQYYADRERLDVLGAQAEAALAGVDALLTPTTTWHPTLSEVAADPVGANSRMGRYTNFANLLDKSAISVPAGTVDGLPFGVMLTGPAFADAALAALADRIEQSEVELLVVGAHLSGQPLNHELRSAGAVLVGPVETAPEYRLYELDTVPRKPGLVRAPGGREISGELWRVPVAGFGRLVAGIPAPLGIGKVLLADGSIVPGFICEPEAVQHAREITAHGGWLAWLESSAAPVG